MRDSRVLGHNCPNYTGLQWQESRAPRPWPRPCVRGKSGPTKQWRGSHVGNYVGAPPSGRTICEEGPALGHLPATDTDLALLVAAGDEGAFAELYDRYSRVVFSMALNVLRDYASARI